MSLRNSADNYGTLAKLLHWLVAIGIFYSIYLGLQQSDMERGDARSAVRALHGSVAVVVLLLMTLRLVWRLTNETPAHPAGMPAWQRGVASLVHWALYIAVFVQILAGMMVVSTGGKPVPFFGLFSIPLPVAENREAHEMWEEVHEYTWWAIGTLVTVHVLAAVYNHFVLKNDVLRRMTTGAPESG